MRFTPDEDYSFELAVLIRGLENFKLQSMDSICRLRIEVHLREPATMLLYWGRLKTLSIQ